MQRIRGRSIHTILGGGRVADLLLWRNRMKSGGFLVVALTIWCVFEAWEYTFITLVCQILMLGMFVISCWSTAAKFLNCPHPRGSLFSISEHKVMNVVMLINILLLRIFRISSEGTVSCYIAVLASLWMVSLIGNLTSSLNLICSVTLILFVGPVAYEMWGNYIRTLWGTAIRTFRSIKKVVTRAKICDTEQHYYRRWDRDY